MSAPEVVTVVRAQRARYGDEAPFHPGERYPEAPFPETASAPNPAYEAVRRAFRVGGFDAERFGGRDWNPLGGIVRPGDRVLLKPNLVKESHPRDPDGWRYVLTHGSVIRAVADYVVLALGGRGSIWLADAPQTDSSWSRIVEVLQLDRLVAYYADRGVELELVDLRRQEWSHLDGVITQRRDLPGDPRGYVAFDLGGASEFCGHAGAGRYYGADYATDEVNAHHSGGRHEYLISGSAIAADVFINLPKMKTHKKAGITCSLKNLVGINGDKNWLPHHTEGPPSEGGDEVPVMSWVRRVERASVRTMRLAARSIPVLGPVAMVGAKQAGKLAFGDTETVVRSGNWHGNDTTWRMCLDLNKLLLWGRPDGRLTEALPERRKRYLSVVDGVIAGEGAGPMNPDPVEAGVVLVGTDPAAVDTACALLMGFDPDRLPIVREAFRSRGWPVASSSRESLRLVSDEAAWNGPTDRVAPEQLFRFRPHFGWTGHLEAAWR